MPGALIGRMAGMAALYTGFYPALGWFIFKDREL